MIYLGLLLFFVVEYVRPSSYVPALLPLHLNAIVPIFNFGGTLVTRGTKSLNYILEAGNTWVVFGMLALVGMSVLTADVTEYAYSGFMTVLGYAMAFIVLMCELTTIERIKGVFKVLIVVHLIVAALNPAVFLDPEVRHYIASGFFLGDGNDFALSINVAVPMALYLMTDTRKVIPKILWGAALLGLVAGVVMTKSRGGTLALGAIAFLFWLKSDKKAQTAAVASVVVVLLLVMAPGAYFERMSTIGDTQEGSAAGRIAAWGAGIEMMLSNPLLGVGAGHFGVKYGTEFHPDDARPGEKTAHSLYFLALGELGLPGIGLVLGFFIYNLVAHNQAARAIAQRKIENQASALRLLHAQTASLVAFAVGGAFLSCLYYPHMYVLCGLLSATRRVLALEKDTSVAEEPAPVALTHHWALSGTAAAPGTKRLLR